MICPDCHNFLDEQNRFCQACDWKCEVREGIPIYLSSQDSKDEIFQRYLLNYDEISEDDLKESIQNVEYLRTQNEKLFSYIPPVKDLAVCEIGTGKGLLLEHLKKEKPRKLVGIDISIPYLRAIQDANEDIELIVANAENLPYDNEFDVIIAADIIEHVVNVGDFLYCVYRALKPGGYFVVKTPNNEDINIYSRKRGCKYNFVHLRNFNKKTLQTILIGAGFDVVKVIYDGFYTHRKRSYIKNRPFLNKRFDNYFSKKYKNDHDVNKINNHIGRLLMNPIEITMLSRKSIVTS